MNTIAERWISHEAVAKEPGRDCQLYARIGQMHLSDNTNFFSIVCAFMARLKTHSDSFVAGIFRRTQPADSGLSDRLEKEKSAFKERLEQEIKKIDMNDSPSINEGSEWFYL